MPVTRSAANGSANGAANGAASADANRIIAIVTGANSGFGLGLCHDLLANLSVGVGQRVPAAQPRPTAIAPSLTDLGSMEKAPSEPTGVMPSPHPSLTLVLACRSQKNAEEARAKILEQHAHDLQTRRSAGEVIPAGWEEGLRVEYELVDLDCVGGPTGVLSFCQRISAKYPHVTSLFLNAGYAAITEVVIPRFILQILTKGLLHSLHHPRYNTEEIGARSADGERGRVWGVNVLAPYIIAKELAPLLRKSPKSLPFEPRVVYTSSIEAEAEALNETPTDDYQLLEYKTSYRPSKYMGDLVMTQLDTQLSTGERPVRCLIAEPGCVATNIAVAGLGAWQWLVNIKWICYWLSFYLAHLLGSPHHPVWASDGALPMLYCAMVASAYLVPASKVPAPKMHVVARRFRAPTVKYGEVDEWETHTELAEFLADKCDAIRLDWRKREGLGQ
jgi:3-keto steroid reductase